MLAIPSLQSIFYRSFRKRLKKFSGRNFLGRICVFHQGGGSLKLLYRPVDFYRRLNCFGHVIRIYKDSYRTAFVALVFYDNGLIAPIIAAEGLYLGSLLFSGYILPKQTRGIFSLSSAIPLRFFNLFSVVHSIESYSSRGMRLCRTAGNSALLIAKDLKKATLKCSSGWLLRVSLDCLASHGRVSNIGHKFFRIPNAGYNRQKGIRPTVRGVVKNPCDHPHGGGEGKGSPPSAQLSPWSKLTKGTPTTKKKWAKRRRRLFKTVILKKK